MDEIKEIKDSTGIFTHRFPGGDVVVSTIYKKTIKDSYRVVPNTATQQGSAQIDEHIEKIKQLETENRKLKRKIENLITEKEQQESSYIDYIEKIESQLSTAPSPSSSIHRNGKSLEVGSRKVYDLIRLYAMGNSVKSICKDTGCSRGQVERILKGTLKHQKSKERVLKAINKLLQTNQNPDILEKLTKLKGLYV